MRTFLYLYLLVALPFWILDGIWLGVVARRFYRDALGDLMARKVKLIPAILFYLMYPAGMVLFVLLAQVQPVQAGVIGAAFGCFCYGTYDLVNHATIEGWPLRLTVVDMAWGTAASGAACFVARLIT